MILRESSEGVRPIGRVMVTESTSGFTCFDVVKKYGEPTGMVLRLNSPPGATLKTLNPALRGKRSWLPFRRKLTTASNVSSGSGPARGSEEILGFQIEYRESQFLRTIVKFDGVFWENIPLVQ